MIDIRLSGKAPIYEQLYNGIAGLISSGRLQPDEKLPAVREVAKYLGINPNTVQKAYAQLEAAGLIYSMPSKGSYVSGGSKAGDALKAEALKKLAAELESARCYGVTHAEAMAAVDKIYNEKRDNDD